MILNNPLDLICLAWKDRQKNNCRISHFREYDNIVGTFIIGLETIYDTGESIKYATTKPKLNEYLKNTILSDFQYRLINLLDSQSSRNILSALINNNSRCLKKYYLYPEHFEELHNSSYPSFQKTNVDIIKSYIISQNNL